MIISLHLSSFSCMHCSRDQSSTALTALWMSPCAPRGTNSSIVERLSIAFTANGKLEFQVEKFLKWADKSSLKQFLWIKLAWIYRFSCSYNEQKTISEGETCLRLPFAINAMLNLSGKYHQRTKCASMCPHWKPLRNDDGPSLVPWGTPAGTGPHS